MSDSPTSEAPKTPEPPQVQGAIVPTLFEEALNVAGNGRYNYLLATSSAFILLSLSIDLFGFSLVVTAACDLDLNLRSRAIILSLPFIGIFLTSYAWGYISDTCGRRYTLIRALNIGFGLSVCSSISYNWIVLAFLKFLAVCFYCAGNSSTYTLVGESCVARVRSRYTLLMTCLLVLAPAAAASLAYPTLYHDFSLNIPWLGIVFRPWRLLLIVLALPLGIGGVISFFFFESPKFLANWDRHDEALEVIKKIHAINHKGREEFTIRAVVLEDERVHKDMTFCRKIFEQGAPLFRKPYLRRTLQLYFLVSIVYMTNNSFIVWLPQIMMTIHATLDCKTCKLGDLCSMIDPHLSNPAASPVSQKKTVVCAGRIETVTILTLIGSQSTYGMLNLVCAMFPARRRLMMICILLASTLGSILVTLIPHPVLGVIFYVVVTSTCLGMGILASYFIDLYPTSYRGMVQCLSIMVGRSSTFCGVNLVGNTIFSQCHATFAFFAVLVFTGVIVAWFLPPDKPSG